MDIQELIKSVNKTVTKDVTFTLTGVTDASTFRLECAANITAERILRRAAEGVDKNNLVLQSLRWSQDHCNVFLKLRDSDKPLPALLEESKGLDSIDVTFFIQYLILDETSEIE